MGLGRSRSRDMDRETGESQEDRGESSSDGTESMDIQTILSYLIRSGQIRILTSTGYSGAVHGGDDDDDGDDDDEYFPSADPAEEDPTPETSALEDSDIKKRIEVATGCNKPNSTIPTLTFKREIGQCGRKTGGFSNVDCRQIGSNFLPNTFRPLANFHRKVFCGTFSNDGNTFLSACQDSNIRIYNTENNKFKLMKSVKAKDVGWSIIDTAFSPDGHFLAYSSWSDYIHICNIHGEQSVHEALPMSPEGHHNFCVFSVTFSADNREIFGGANDGCIYIYDRERNERTLRIDSHEDDLGTVALADNSSQILYSAGDDGLIKVWDRRTLHQDNPIEVGALAGHTDGITFIDSKKDGRHMVSNSKDQSIKLWDIRKFSGESAKQRTRRAVATQNWDYRWQQAPRRARRRQQKIEGDTSLMTYRGHSVLHTLIRCRFSPEFTTGQRYIYSGCATGAVVIYDVLTGKIVKKLREHRACVRDVSWHPFDQRLISTSWDSFVGEWAYRQKPDYESPMESDSENQDEDDIFGSLRRRSARLRELRRRNCPS